MPKWSEERRGVWVPAVVPALGWGPQGLVAGACGLTGKLAACSARTRAEAGDRSGWGTHESASCCQDTQCLVPPSPMPHLVTLRRQACAVVYVAR